MCFLLPHTIKSIKGNRVTLKSGIEAFYDKKIGTLEVGDEVLVYGNLIISKITDHGTQNKS